MIVDFDSKVFDKIFFGPTFIDINTLQFVPGTDPLLTLNVNKEGGFIRLYDARGVNPCREWQQYKVELDGKFTKLTSGILADSYLDLKYVSTISTNEDYAIVYVKMMNNFTSTDLFLPQSGLFVLFIGYNQIPVYPSLLYYTSLPDVTFHEVSCDILFVEAGQVCTLTMSRKDGIFPEKFFYARIKFLSSGSVIDLTITNRVIPNIPIDSKPIIKVNGLPFGGYLLTYTTIMNDEKNKSHFIFGYLFYEDNKDPISWKFTEPVSVNIFRVFKLLPHNNTLLVSQIETNNSWKFLVIDLPKFAGNIDNGYSNLHVKSTVPAINSFINSNISKISIDFYKPVELSNGKLSIYQVISNKTYLRQLISSLKCSMENNKTVIADVLESTFSASKGSYFVKMDNNFVKDRAYKEPLLGIRENVWKFITKEKSDTFSPSTTGFLRLNSSGTQLFDNLSQEERNNFFNTLLKELSDAVPVNLSRLTTSRIGKKMESNI
jgi:hypothetical protein